MRGQLPKKVGGKGTPKPVAILPPEVHERLNDTVLTRIAEGVPLDQQVEFATAVADGQLSEPRVREAIRDLRANEGRVTPTEAVEGASSRARSAPVTLPDVAKRWRQELEHFLGNAMTIDGVERDRWEVLDVLLANRDLIPLEARGLASMLADLSVRADAYSTRLRSGDEQPVELIEATA